MPGAEPNHWIPIAFALAALTLHLALVGNRVREAWMIAIVAPLGFGVDTALTSLGHLEFHRDALTLGPAPVWIACLWVIFATTFNSSMRWLHGRPLVAFLLGAIGSPLSYRAGASFDAVTIPGASLWPSWIALGVGWALATPLLMAVAAAITRGGSRTTHLEIAPPGR